MTKFHLTYLKCPVFQQSTDNQSQKCETISFSDTWFHILHCSTAHGFYKSFLRDQNYKEIRQHVHISHVLLLLTKYHVIMAYIKNFCVWAINIEVTNTIHGNCCLNWKYKRKLGDNQLQSNMTSSWTKTGNF
jgi:hypothetical protein